MSVEETPTKAPSKKINSRWRKGAVRYSNDRTMDDSRWVANAKGHKRLDRDAPTEVRFCERRHEGAGWRHGARIRQVANSGVTE